MALLMTFLHDDALAAKPLGVVTALIQLGGSFLFVSVFVGFVVAAAAGAFVLAFMLRNDHFVLYLLACVGCWTIVIWISIVVMRVLGNQYHRHRPDSCAGTANGRAGAWPGSSDRTVARPTRVSVLRLQRRAPLLVEVLEALAGQLLEDLLLVATLAHQPC